MLLIKNIFNVYNIMFVQKSNKYVLVNREPLEPLLIYSLARTFGTSILMEQHSPLQIAGLVQSGPCIADFINVLNSSIIFQK